MLIIEKYLDSKKESKDTYRSAIRNFFDWRYDILDDIDEWMEEEGYSGSPDNTFYLYKYRQTISYEKYVEKILKEFRGIKKKELASQYLIQKVLQPYFNYLKDTYAPKTTQSYFFIVKDFLVDAKVLNKYEESEERGYSISLTDNLQWEKFLDEHENTLKDAEQITGARKPSDEELAAIAHNLDLQERAITLCLASSGLRIGTLLNIKREHLYLDEKPTRIHIPKEISKSDIDRDNFLTTEAKEALEDFLNKKDERTKTVFPIIAGTYRKRWKKTCKKLGIYEVSEKTGRMKVKPHKLRAYFNGVMAHIAKIPEKYAEYWLGHKGYLDPEYFNPDVKQLRDKYNRARDALSVMDKYKTRSQLLEENRELQQKLKKLKRGE